MSHSSHDVMSHECDATREAALELLAEAWNAAEDEGIDGLVLAHASISAALATMVGRHGEEETARLVAGLVDRIRQGEYSLTLQRSLQ